MRVRAVSDSYFKAKTNNNKKKHASKTKLSLGIR